MLQKKIENTWFNRARYFLYATAFIPLIIMPFGLDMYSLPKAVVLWFIAISLFLCWTAGSIREGYLFFQKTPLFLPLLALSIVLLASLLFGLNFRNSLFGSWAMRHETLFTWLSYIFLFFASANFLSRKDAKTFTLTIAAVSIPLLCLAIADFLFGPDIYPWEIPAGIETGRASATLGNPVFLGGFAAFSLSLIASLFFIPGRISRFIVLSIAFFICSLGLLATLSRGAWVGALAGLATLLYYVLFKSANRKSYLFVLLCAILVTAVLIFNFTIPGEYSLPERITSAIKLEGSVAARLTIMKSSLFIIADRPLIGWGIENMADIFPSYRIKEYITYEGTRISDRAHNQLLDMGIIAGVPGILIMLWIIFVFIRTALTAAFSKPYDASNIYFVALFAACLAYLVFEQSAFSLVGVTPFFWVSAGILAKPVKNNAEIKIKLPENSRFLMLFVIVFAVFAASFPLRFQLADIIMRTASVKARDFGYTSAIPLYERAVYLNPYNRHYRADLSEAYRQTAALTKDDTYIKEAITLLENGIEMYPQGFELYNLLGNVYITSVQMGNYDHITKAKDAYIEALGLEPLLSSARLWLGICYFFENDLEMAEMNIKKSLPGLSSPQEIKTAKEMLDKILKKKEEAKTHQNVN